MFFEVCHEPIHEMAGIRSQLLAMPILLKKENKVITTMVTKPLDDRT